MGLKLALRNVKDKSSTVYIISLSSKCHRPHNAIPLSTLFQCPHCSIVHAIPVFWRDHFRSAAGITYGSGIICGPIWGSSAVGDHLRSRNHLQRCTGLKWRPRETSAVFSGYSKYCCRNCSRWLLKPSGTGDLAASFSVQGLARVRLTNVFRSFGQLH